MIIHFGINPVSGGSPPKESRVSRIIGIVIGSLFHIWEVRGMDVIENGIKSRNIESVRKI